MRMPSPRYEPYALVYLRANGDMCGAITGYLVGPTGTLQYLVTWGDDCGESAHWEGELTTEKSFGGSEGGE